jgi:hypothetical protein
MALGLTPITRIPGSRPRQDNSYLSGVSTSQPGQGGVGFGARAAERFGDKPPPPPPPDNTDAPPPSQAPRPLNWQDSSYNAQIAALDRALRDFETGASTRGQRYQEDFATGLDRLGFRPAPQATAARSTEGEPAGGGVGFDTGPLQGEFDVEGQFDRTSAAARGSRGMRDEFAGRGTLRSSDYVNSFRDFQNRLQQQLTGMETGRTRFGQDLQTELAQFQARTGEQRAAAEESARSRAIMRSIQGMGF